MATSYVAVLEAADPGDLMECPNKRVHMSRLPRNQVRLVGGYEDLIQVLTGFVGMTGAEADIHISALV